MRMIAKYFALLMLIVLIGPPLLFLVGVITDLPTIKTIMLAATMLWFASATVWMWPDKQSSER